MKHIIRHKWRAEEQGVLKLGGRCYQTANLNDVGTSSTSVHSGKSKDLY
jgi:hypothetical protein